MILGFDFIGNSFYKLPTSPIINIINLEMENAIFDEIGLREKTDFSISPEKLEWEMDTYLLAKFMNNLEAGNIANGGIKIEKFAIKRRKVNELDNLTLKYLPFYNNHQFQFSDYTQQSADYIYSIVPIGENDLEGQENSVYVNSEFTGWFVVDGENNEVLPFDKAINEPNVSVSLNQGRVLIEGLKKYPNVYYTDTSYNTFTLETVIMRNEWERLGETYEKMLSQFVHQTKPFLAKSGDGAIYVVDVHTPTRTSPLNTWKNREYITLQLNCTEIMSYDEYMKNLKSEGAFL